MAAPSLLSATLAGPHRLSPLQRTCAGVGAGLLILAAGTAVHAAHHGHEGHSAAARPAVAQPAAASPVQVSGAWIRATVKGQQGTGGFMRLVSAQPVSLVGFASPVAGASELHEMRMEGDVMRMRPIESLALPAGQAVDLKPGGHHLMLMGLKQALKAGSTVPLVLKLKTAEGRLQEQRIDVPVRSTPPADAPASTAGDHNDHSHDHHHH